MHRRRRWGVEFHLGVWETALGGASEARRRPQKMKRFCQMSITVFVLLFKVSQPAA